MIPPAQGKQKLFKPRFLPCSLSYRSLDTSYIAAKTTGCLPLPIFLTDSLEMEMEIQRHLVHLLLSLLHLQIGTHGVQKTHRHHLHPLPPLHHPKKKTLLIRNHTDKRDWFRKLFFQQAESSPLHCGRGFLQVPPLPILHHYLLRSPAASGREANTPFLSIIRKHDTRPHPGFQNGNAQADQKCHGTGEFAQPQIHFESIKK